MRELPIIFNTEMVKAILEGRKVSTRRPLMVQPMSHHWNIFDSYKLERNLLECQNGLYCCFRHTAEVKGQFLRDEDVDVKSPYQVGDILYVRETYCNVDNDGDIIDPIYKADGFDSYEDGDGWRWSPKWKPSIHMPKSAARLFLEVTSVRVERVQDITNEGCRNEGVASFGCVTHRLNFQNLWNSIYNNWDSNPWVWVIDFKVIKRS